METFALACALLEKNLKYPVLNSSYLKWFYNIFRIKPNFPIKNYFQGHDVLQSKYFKSRKSLD
jgi:hypothetical protein